MTYIFYWIRLSFFLSMITISLITFQRTDLFNLIIQADFEGVQLLLNDNITLLLTVTFILMIIQNAFTLIPLLLLITFNMVLFGFFYGVIWSWLTSVVAAVIIFLVARYIFQDRLVEKLNTDLKDKIEANGLLYVFIGRVFPFVPTSLVNIVSAVSSIHLKHFLAATACGNLIYFFLLGLLPMSLIKLGLNYYTIGLLLLVIIVVFNIYTFLIKKKKSTWSIKSMSG
ncbi:TVP38/TMEM64 family protein [Alkalihalobacterium chitinilyticum]|uniref:TVP38/TMEM64 family membrane protein n=1 Tax=Alkalihalobacterium chitinilyticum TaxID=2980103 RepID=A0ABT5VE21_9BACI|nr:VTT domain-containing protein [Alkalihalobacterium chitinilyticum]MDE5413707.1 VTT domain-containing protein [Alkalihalobacterium chitinilyticum]